ncbi:MAG TPA: NUDIX domain-containing protein [Candidatus Saccharimonadia bacterium]|nr:NUDIX domain-containing protein [Candidatus Saccharimonadia bacterium]
MDELWQLYDEQGQALNNKGARKDEVFSNGLLHAASHVWIWREADGIVKILLQKRAASKQTWPNCYDISAAGHIDLGETPLDAALREAKEEIALDIAPRELRLFGVHRAHLTAENGAIENEFQHLYSLELTSNTNFTLQDSEVESLVWMSMDQFKAECTSDQYVPHTKIYYDTVIAAIESAAQ